MTTRADELMERGLAEIGIGMPGHGQETRTGDRDEHGAAPEPDRAKRVVDLVCGQVRAQQESLDSSLAVSMTISYNADKLAEEFSVPVGRILSAFARERQSGRLLADMMLTSDHRALITLAAMVRE